MITPEPRPTTAVSRSGAARPCRCPKANHQHGTYLAYLTDSCRCGPCLYAGRREAKRIRYRTATGTHNYVDAASVRAHVEKLLHTLTLAQITARSGVSHPSIRALLGAYSARPASKRIMRRTARALLAVTSDHVDPADTGRVDATGTRRRLQALVAIGYSLEQLAHRAGLLSLHPVATRNTAAVTTRTRDAVPSPALSASSSAASTAHSPAPSGSKPPGDPNPSSRPPHRERHEAMPKPIDKRLVPLIVQLLDEGRAYREIAELTGVSRSTVANVARRNGMTNYDPRVEEAAAGNRERGLNRYEAQLEKAEQTVEELYDLALAEPPVKLDPMNRRKSIGQQAVDHAERLNVLTKRIMQAERRRKTIEAKLLEPDHTSQPEVITPGDLTRYDEAFGLR